MTPPPAGRLSWLLNDLVDRVEQVHQAVLLSRDGLVIAASRELTRAEAEFLAALSSGFNSLANGARDHYGAKRVRQALIELDDKLFFVLPAGQGSCLAVLSTAGPKAGIVAYEMALLIKRVSQHFGVAARSEQSGPAAGSR